jgi:hypothetical protein
MRVTLLALVLHQALALPAIMAETSELQADTVSDIKIPDGIAGLWIYGLLAMSRLSENMRNHRSTSPHRQVGREQFGVHWMSNGTTERNATPLMSLDSRRPLERGPTK